MLAAQWQHRYTIKSWTQKMKRYLKLFLASAIPFGISMGIFNSFQHGIHSGLVAGVVSGVFFGGLMSVILAFLHSRTVRRMPYGKSEEAMGVYHIRNVELMLPYDKAFDLCVEALSMIKNCKVQDEDRSQGKILGKAGKTWKTFGDTISFELTKIGNEIQIEVSSRPTVPTTLVDYGKNLENVNKIEGFLKAHREDTV